MRRLGVRTIVSRRPFRTGCAALPLQPQLRLRLSALYSTFGHWPRPLRSSDNLRCDALLTAAKLAHVGFCQPVFLRDHAASADICSNGANLLVSQLCARMTLASGAATAAHPALVVLVMRFPNQVERVDAALVPHLTRMTCLVVRLWRLAVSEGAHHPMRSGLLALKLHLRIAVLPPSKRPQNTRLTLIADVLADEA